MANDISGGGHSQTMPTISVTLDDHGDAMAFKQFTSSQSALRRHSSYNTDNER